MPGFHPDHKQAAGMLLVLPLRRCARLPPGFNSAASKFPAGMEARLRLRSPRRATLAPSFFWPLKKPQDLKV